MKKILTLISCFIFALCVGCGEDKPSHDELIEQIGAANRAKAERQQKFEQSAMHTIYMFHSENIINAALPDRNGDIEISIKKDAPEDKEFAEPNGDPEVAYEEGYELFKSGNFNVSLTPPDGAAPFTEDEKTAVMQAFSEKGFTVHIYFYGDSTNKYYLTNGEIHIEPIPEV